MPSTSNHAASAVSRRAWIQAGLAVVLSGAIAAGLIYWMTENTRVYIDTAMVEAPVISLSPTSAGRLENVFVNEGDEVSANMPVAQVGNELVKTKIAGIITSVPDQIGAEVSPGQEVIEMIDPSQLRVVGKIDENKGLSRIAVGDPASFTVDAFGGKEYTGIVDEISPTSVQSGIVFNISDQRPTQQFAVKVRFDQSAYPELKNGMSARIWIYPQH